MLPSGGKTLNVVMKFTADPAGANQAAEVVDKTKKKVAEGGKAAEQATGKMAGMGAAAGQLAAVGTAMAAMSGIMLLSARSYVNQVGTGEAVARRWLGSTKEMEQAQVRIGRSIATAAAPYMEKLADMTTKAADFVEKNPDAVKAVVGFGTTAGAIGGLMVGAAGAMKTAQTVGTLFKSGGLLAGLGPAAGTAGKGLLAGLFSPVGAVLGGLTAGLGVNDLLSKTQFGKNAGIQSTAKVATVGAYEAGKLFGGESKGIEWAKAVGEFTGAVEKAGAASKNAGKEIDFSSQEIAAYASYARQGQVVDRERGIQLYRMTRDFNRQMLFEEEDFGRQRGRALRDFARQESFTEADYYRQRSLQARDFNIEIQRSEEDHQRSMRRAKEDFDFSMWDILRSGDAMAYMRATRQYNVSRSRAEEDYQIQMSRRNEDYARQLADQEREYQIQRSRRQQEFKIRLKDEDQDYTIRRTRAKEQFALALKDEQVSYNEQQLARRQALLDQLRDMRGNLEQERILRQQFSAAMLDDLRRAVSAGASGTNLYNQASSGGRASGGYVSSGLWRLHDNEFVLNPQTTREAERLARGKLSQDSVLAALAGSGAASRNGGGVTWNDHRRFDSRLTPEDRQQIRRDTEKILLDALRS
jgi:hypothetical protein